ncbi:hypothetical protein V8Z77_03065 [Stutzerimonas stutzeri]|uniref:hypothetical protein n=1 Tax=Stutzerimonas stutzeri TaxID=316 RepID=UPI000C9C056E|nr:hypothetical protein [Stutzerimonas stutzeri]PNG11981.1 hypothetical protein CXK97_19920 [Stutzerimonas stutzeri]
MLYSNSRMETYRTTHVTLDDPCQVRIEVGMITVEYISGGEPVTYQGYEKGPGHYELRGVGFDGRATLHAFDESVLLEGGWIEENAKGMWRIWLS